ncbi:MAG: nucleotidyltransferase family protein [Magnetococcales bacterium]|nr:nucleotidyltransferase family protein [Magnetococcales bacterium]
MAAALPSDSRLLIRVLKQPELFSRQPVAVQDLLLRQARRASLLGRLEFVLRRQGLLEPLSPRVNNHLQSARRLVEEDQRMLVWEVNRVQRALWQSGLAITLLKGGAYVFLDLPVAQGRHVADLDLLMRQQDFPLIEACMARHGWLPAKLHPYDQRYYREWMHELPPLTHRHRLTELDIHHTILPPVSRLRPDPQLLLASARDVPGHPNLKTLSPVDMVLHAAVHLFQDSDFDKGLRGLLDLDGLLDWGAEDPLFWTRLLPRAQTLGLIRPLYYALHFCRRWLDTVVPDDVLATIAVQPQVPGTAARMVMNQLVDRIMTPGDPDHLEWSSWFAWSFLYIRSHWLRMPPGMLVVHLTRKGLRRWRFDVRNRRVV